MQHALWHGEGAFFPVNSNKGLARGKAHVLETVVWLNQENLKSGALKRATELLPLGDGKGKINLRALAPEWIPDFSDGEELRARQQDATELAGQALASIGLPALPRHRFRLLHNSSGIPDILRSTRWTLPQSRTGMSFRATDSIPVLMRLR
jgi:hypothetical protein